MNKLSIIAALLIGASSVSYAGQELEIGDGKAVEASISIDKLTHISVKDDRITDLYSDAKITFFWDKETGQIELTPIKRGLFTLGLKTESGLYQEILFNTQKNAQQNIVLSENETMKARRAPTAKMNWDDGGWEIRRVLDINGDIINVEHIAITNRFKTTRSLRGEAFLEPDGMSSIAVPKYDLLPNETIIVYRTTKKRQKQRILKHLNYPLSIQQGKLVKTLPEEIK